MARLYDVLVRYGYLLCGVGKVKSDRVELWCSVMTTSNGAVKYGKVALRCALVAYCQGEVTYGASWSGKGTVWCYEAMVAYCQIV